jgi:hypothetical protein
MTDLQRDMERATDALHALEADKEGLAAELAAARAELTAYQQDLEAAEVCLWFVCVYLGAYWRRVCVVLLSCPHHRSHACL